MLVVDAMNVIGSRPTGWWRDREGAIRDLAARLRDHADGEDIPITVVIDGQPIEGLPEGRHGRLDVRYAHASARDAADDRIVDLLDELPRPVTVVTADRELRGRAAERGADLMGPSAMLRRLEEP